MNDNTLVGLLQAQTKNALSVVNGQHLFMVRAEKPLSKLFNRAMATNGFEPWNCSTCDQFIDRFGRMVTVDEETGKLTSVVWNIVTEDLDERVRNIILTMKEAVEGSRIASLYVSKLERVSGMEYLGYPLRGGFDHLYLYNNENAARHTVALKKAVDVNFQRLVTFKVVWKDKLSTLNELRINMTASNASQTRRLGEGLQRQIEWLEKLVGTKNSNDATALTWLQAAAYGQYGRCGIRGTVVGEAALNFESGGWKAARTAIAEFAGALNYQCPTTRMENISDNNFQREVDGIKELGYGESIKRRTVKAEEVAEHAIWTRPEVKEEKKEEDIFAAARGIKSEPESIDVTGEIKTITFDTFFDKVLPKAKRIYLDTDSNQRGVVTAMFVGPDKEDSKPILAYHTEENNNPYSWACSPKPIPMHLFAEFGKYLEVTRLFRTPSLWNGGSFKHFNGVMFHCPAILPKDGFGKPQIGGKLVKNPLFPSLIKPELYQYRKTIEAVNAETYIDIVESQLMFTDISQFDTFPHIVVDDGEKRVKYQLFEENV